MTNPATHDDTLARIAELTPRTVTTKQRERAVPVVMAAMREAEERGTDIPSGNRWLDRIIDALGWTAAEPEKHDNAAPADAPHQCADVQDDCCERTPPPPFPPAPVVLDADDLFALSNCLREWADLAFNIGVDESHEIPTGVGRISYNESTCKWVLRIGGGDE